MAEAIAKRFDLNVSWGPVIAGAFIALSLALVLNLFAGAFAAAGLGTLASIWMVLTPLVSTFVGAAVCANLVGRRAAYLNGILVWCLSLIAGALLFGAGLMRAGFSGGLMALSGLAALLGLAGALIGSAVGPIEMTFSRRRAGKREAPEVHAAEERYEKTPTVSPGPSGPSADRPELRH
ncbi:MAG: hypothetical protein ACYC8T_02220 [Myxococcaceae bacterium]